MLLQQKKQKLTWPQDNSSEPKPLESSTSKIHRLSKAQAKHPAAQRQRKDQCPQKKVIQKILMKSIINNVT